MRRHVDRNVSFARSTRCSRKGLPELVDSSTMRSAFSGLNKRRRSSVLRDSGEYSVNSTLRCKPAMPFGGSPAAAQQASNAAPSNISARHSMRAQTLAHSVCRRKHRVSIKHRSIDADALHRGPRGCRDEHCATRTATDRAGHELLERHLTGNRVAAREVCRGGQHRCRTTGKDLDFCKFWRGECFKPNIGKLGHKPLVATGETRAARKAARDAPIIKERHAGAICIGNALDVLARGSQLKRIRYL